MSSQRKSWLPREGFHLSVLATIVKQTLLNPTLTLPLFLLTQYTNNGRAFALDHPTAANRLKNLLYLGVARYVNGYLNRGAQNNWTSDTPQWDKELVVVTGGSDGIGRLLVGKFAEKGVKVIVLDIQEVKGLGASNNVHYIKCDLSKIEDIQAAGQQIREQHGDPSVILLNAGIINRHSILNTPDHLLRRVFDINTLSHYRLLKEFLPAMVKANHGLICTTASLAGFTTCPGMVDYAGTKAAAVAFHEGLTSELVVRYNAPKIRTICVCPNFVHTKLAEGFKNDSHFTNPTLYPETVAEAQFAKIWSWDGGLLPVPSVQGIFAMTMRSWPHWMQNSVRDKLKDVMQGVENLEQERVRELKEAEEKVSQSVVEVKNEDGSQPEMFG